MDMPWLKYIEAHTKKCNLCRRHDRLASSGGEYTPKELARYAAHIRKVQTTIKQVVEDEELGVHGKL